MVINRSKSIPLIMFFLGGAFIAAGVCFLYSNMLTPTEFLKIFGNSLTIIGVIIIMVSVVSIAKPIIKADTSGVFFYISFGPSPIYISWQHIKKIELGYQAISTLGPYVKKAKCLIFELDSEYKKKIPRFIKGAFIMLDSKIYFAEASLSISVEYAVNQLNSLQRSGR